MTKSVAGMALLFLLTISTAAYAQNGKWIYCPYCGHYLGMKGGYGAGPGMGGEGMMEKGYGQGSGIMGSEALPAWNYFGQSEECRRFLDDTADLRKELNQKRFDYYEAIRNPKSKPETVTKLEKELDNIQGKIYAKEPLGCKW